MASTILNLFEISGVQGREHGLSVRTVEYYGTSIEQRRDALTK